MRTSLPRTLIATCLATAAVAFGAAPASAQSATVCPATFQVLHDDRIGNLELQAGPYRVTVRGGLSCAAASELFAQFLQDWDGRLPRPWRLNVRAASFQRGSSGAGFSVRRVDSPNGGGGGRHPHFGRLCPGTFRVLHNDRIGALSLPRGPYYVTVLSLNRPTCRQASRLFARFLQDVDGVLPRPWALDPQTATFRRGAGNFGFRVKPAGD